MRLPIKAKISLASLITVSLVAWVVGFMLSAQQSLVSLMDVMIQKNMAAMRIAEQIKYNAVLYDDLVFRYLLTNDRVLFNESGRVRDKARAWLGQMKVLCKGETEQELLAEIEDEISKYDRDVKALVTASQFKTEDQKRSVTQLIKSLETGEGAIPRSPGQSHQQTLALLSAEGRARLTRIYSQCEKLVDISRSKLEDAQARVRETVEKTELTALAAAGAVIVATLLVAFVLAMSLVNPLKRLLSGVQKVTTGEFNLELPVDGSDEIGRLTREFNTMARNLEEKQQRLVTETITDSLTELHNFRYFQTHLKDEISRATRYKHTFALLIIDIDHFKHFNDTNGHQMGNVILKEIATTLKETLRREDFIARYGGEEFVVILPETDKVHALPVAERLRNAIEQSDFPGREKQPLGKISVSIGAAIFPEHGGVPTRLIEAADKALYAAKAAGRNKVVWADEGKNSAAST